jgi:hypothetical protein
MDDRTILSCSLVAVAALALVSTMLDEIRIKRLQRRARLDASRLDEMQAEIQGCETVLTMQAKVLYNQAVTIHGQAAADRAIQQARDRGIN